jgi:hypothetical protein
MRSPVRARRVAIASIIAAGCLRAGDLPRPAGRPPLPDVVALVVGPPDNEDKHLELRVIAARNAPR